MKVLCIAASQVTNRGTSSYSYVISQIIQNIVEQNSSDHETEIIHFENHDLTPCVVCQKCANNHLCIFDDGFNEIHTKIKDADVVFITCPVYAGLPSKLAIVLEKLQEICFIESMKGDLQDWPLIGKPFGLVVHGGSTTANMAPFEHLVLNPLASCCKSLGIALKSSVDFTDGIMFGVQKFSESSNPLQPNMIYNYDDIEEQLTPFVSQYL